MPPHQPPHRTGKHGSFASPSRKKPALREPFRSLASYPTAQNDVYCRVKHGRLQVWVIFDKSHHASSTSCSSAVGNKACTLLCSLKDRIPMLEQLSVKMPAVTERRTNTMTSDCNVHDVPALWHGRRACGQVAPWQREYASTMCRPWLRRAACLCRLRPPASSNPHAALAFLHGLPTGSHFGQKATVHSCHRCSSTSKHWDQRSTGLDSTLALRHRRHSIHQRDR